jgi:hypothetical protein
VKYELPRFFGITKTLRPVFRLPPLALAEDEDEADVDADDEAAADVAAALLEEEEEDDEQAAAAGATSKSGRASHVARLGLMVCILSILNWCSAGLLWLRIVESGFGWACLRRAVKRLETVGYGAMPPAAGTWRRPSARARPR